MADAGGITGAFDCLNAHPYTGANNPEKLLSDGGLNGSGYGSLAWHRARLAKMGGPSTCMVATEAGEHNNTAAREGHIGSSEKVAGKYLPRVSLEYARKGFARTYLYELVDESPDGCTECRFGLLRYGLSEKPAFKALKNMIALLGDTASSNHTFVPGRLDYQLSGDIADVSQMLFQKADGTFYLALWLGKNAWNWQNGTEIVVPSQQVRLSVPTRQTFALHLLEDSGEMTHGAAQAILGGALNLQVSDRVTFVALR